MNKHYIACSCHSAEHTARIIDDGEDLYLEVQLCQTSNILRRIYLAFRYILGYTCRYGHWDCTIIDEAEGKKLMHFLKRKYK
jgi:hypothetical protein